MIALNYAKKIYIGGAEASAVYVGATKVWPFKPTDLSGCRIWIYADYLKQIGSPDGSDISWWPNQAGGPHPTFPGSPLPKIRYNALNTLPCVRVTQGAGKIRFTGTGVDKDYTLVYVGRKWRATIGRVIAANAPPGGNILVGFHGAEGDVAHIEGWITSPSSPPANTLWKLYSADSTSTAVARFFNNGVLSSSGTATPALGWGGTFNISGYQNGADAAVNQEADCEIAEVVMYNRKLSDAERMYVEGYLRNKWINPSLWKPTDLGANLVGWFDSSNLATVGLVGSGVNNWFSGVGTMVASQATSANMPPYASSGGVNFTVATGLFMQNCPASFDVVMVAKPNPPAAAPVDWRTMLRSTNYHEMIIETGTTRLGSYVAGFFPAGGLTWGNVDGIAYARVAPSTAVQISRDGGALTAVGAVLGAASAAPTNGFGCYNGVATPAQGFGLVKEVIFVPYNSSDTTRQKLEGYLAHKWGLDTLLPAGHPYKSAPP